MPLKIIRNDITKMDTEAIVNTANAQVRVGSGCDEAIYKAAGYDELLNYRKEHIGVSKEGKAFITPGFNLKARYIIHAVSPQFQKNNSSVEKKLRSCYKKSLQLAKANGIRSISFSLISTGSFGFPKEEGIRIAVDEINAFLLKNDMQIYLVVFDEKSTELGRKLDAHLASYIDDDYANTVIETQCFPDGCKFQPTSNYRFAKNEAVSDYAETYFDFEEEHEQNLEERMQHMTDTYSEYLMYLIQQKNMENSDVWKRAIVDKKVFSKIKNNPRYHPNKLTALCLCIGAKLNLEETKDLLARAGYALSPCDKTDIIFAYFIENEIYDMIELDIQLEEHGLPCIIS